MILNRKINRLRLNLYRIRKKLRNARAGRRKMKKEYIDCTAQLQDSDTKNNILKTSYEPPRDIYH